MRERRLDVVVVGGGAAGIAAAAAAAKAGAETVLIERSEVLGGVLDQCIHPGFGLHRYREELTGPEFAARLLEELRSSGAEALLASTGVHLRPEGPELWVASPQGLWRLKPRAVVWACGAFERPFSHLLVPGNRPAGIFTAGLAQRLINIHGFLPGRRVLILGSGDIGLILARRLFLEGLEVVGVAEIKPFPGGLLRNVRQCLEDFGIPLLLRHTVQEVHGRERLSAVTLGEVDEAGCPLSGTEKRVAVDTLIVSVGLIPEVRLLRGLVPLDPLNQGPIVNSFLQTALPWLFVAGNSLVVFDLVDTVAQLGEQAGSNAAAYAHGALPQRKWIPLRRGANVLHLVPQWIPVDDSVKIHLRVARPVSPARIRVGRLTSHQRGLRPAEMVEWKLSLDEIQSLRDSPEMVVEVSEA